MKLASYVIIITWTLFKYIFKLGVFIITILVYAAELLTDFSCTNFTVIYSDASDIVRVYFKHYLVCIIK